MNPLKKKILDLILIQPGISNKEIADRLHLKRNSVHWHLRQLLEAEMVVSRWDGRSMNYIILPDIENIMRVYRR